jgi:hypothetical protein
MWLVREKPGTNNKLNNILRWRFVIVDLNVFTSYNSADMEKLTINLNEFTQPQRDICLSCSAEGLIPWSICTLARLEAHLGKTPTFGEAEQAHIRLDKISDNCPNQYKNPANCMVR